LLLLLLLLLPRHAMRCDAINPARKASMGDKPTAMAPIMTLDLDCDSSISDRTISTMGWATDLRD
jgi:hypothetical protein